MKISRWSLELRCQNGVVGCALWAKGAGRGRGDGVAGSPRRLSRGHGRPWEATGELAEQN